MANKVVAGYAEVAKLGNGVKKVCFEGKNETIDTVLSMAGYSREGYEVRVNGATLKRGGKEPAIKDGDVVLLIPQIRAGA